MPIEFHCQNCNRPMRTPDSAAGKKGKCPHCGETMDIPSSSAPQANVPAARTRGSNAGTPSEWAQGKDGDDKIEFPCPQCNLPVRTHVSTAGKKGKCPNCREVIHIPLESAWEPEPQSKPSGKIQFRCPGCQKMLRTPADVVGKKIRCPSCKAVLSVPSSSKRKGSAQAQPNTAPVPDGSIGLAPMDDMPSLVPIDGAPGLLPVDETSGLMPVDEAPALTPLDDGPGLTPLQDAPSLVPLDAPAGLAPVQHQGLTPVADGPLSSAAGYEGSAASNPFGDNLGGPASSAMVNPYQSPALASPSYADGQSRRFSSGRRSGAVTAVGVVNFVMAGLQLICGAVTLLMGGLIGAFAARVEQDVDAEAAAAAGIASTVVIVYGIVTLVCCVLMIMSGIGVLKRANWARVLTLVLGGVYGALAILSLVSIFMGQCGAILPMMLHGSYCTFVYAVLLNRQFADEFG